VNAPEPDPAQMMASRRFVVLLVLAAVVGVVAALAAWGFLELVHQVQVGVFANTCPTRSATRRRRSGGRSRWPGWPA
jgi:hypothetical protein